MIVLVGIAALLLCVNATRRRWVSDQREAIGLATLPLGLSILSIHRVHARDKPGRFTAPVVCRFDSASCTFALVEVSPAVDGFPSHP
jgi:hypothetical protein